jgi:hypothetical protein
MSHFQISLFLPCLAGHFLATKLEKLAKHLSVSQVVIGSFKKIRG